MNKSELIEALSQELNMSTRQSTSNLNTVLETMMVALCALRNIENFANSKSQIIFG